MMNKKYLILGLPFLFCLPLSAQNGRDSILAKLFNDPELKVEKINEELIRITYPDGVQRIKSIAEKVSIKPKSDIGYTYINLPEVDTLKYYWKFKHWQKLLFQESSFNSIMAADVNGNGMIELYGGQYYDYQSRPNVIFEKSQDGMFELVYTYADSLIHIHNIYDIDGDGELEVQMQDNANNGFLELFYEKPHPDSFATKLKFYYPVSSINHSELGNFDGDSFTDIVYLKPAEWIYFAEYNPILNNFDIVASFNDSLHPVNNWLGFAVGDFDSDGLTEFVTGDVFGFVKIKENAGDNVYVETWNGAVNTHNAYTFAETKDIDGNGKPEFWIKGDLGPTKITIFEASGNDQYEIVGEIDLDGAASWNASYMQAIDMDMDGVEEMLVAIDGYVLILRFVGRPGYQVYSLYYIKTLNGLRGAIAAQLLVPGYEKKPELLITSSYYNPNRTDYTNIYVPSDDSVVSVINEEPLPGFGIEQNYPNPFNSNTTVRINLDKSLNTVVKLYNSLGEEIKTLFNKFLTPGSYSINWDGTDESGRVLPSGIYFITVETGKKASVLKTVFLK
jgi:FlgD Ig-like domain